VAGSDGDETGRTVGTPSAEPDSSHDESYNLCCLKIMLD
jgi:hypothetical protein